MASGKNIILCGFMGSGKTTVGMLLSRATGRRMVDTDELIEERAGMSVSEIFAREGEAFFRGLEREVIASVAEESGLIIAVGGGAVLDGRNVDALRRGGVLCYLIVSPEEVTRRISVDGSRPILPHSGATGIAELIGQREIAYRAAADEAIETSGKSPEAVAQEILVELWANRDDNP